MLHGPALASPQLDRVEDVQALSAPQFERVERVQALPVPWFERVEDVQELSSLQFERVEGVQAVQKFLFPVKRKETGPDKTDVETSNFPQKREKSSSSIPRVGTRETCMVWKVLRLC